MSPKFLNINVKIFLLNLIFFNYNLESFRSPRRQAQDFLYIFYLSAYNIIRRKIFVRYFLYLDLGIYSLSMCFSHLLFK